MSSYYRQQLEGWLKTLDIKAKHVLDVGGSQNPIGPKRVKSWDVEEYKILDLPEPHVNSPKPDIECDLNKYYISGENNEPKILLPQIEVNSFEEMANNYRFDIVFCLEVMEYIWNPLQAIKNISFFLNQNGTLYISFPFVYGIHNPEGQDMLRYTPDGAEKLLNEAGFKIEEHIYRRPKTGNSIERFYAQDGMRYRKDTDQEITGSLIKAIKK